MLITRCVLIAGCAGIAASSAFAQSSSDEVRAVVAEMLDNARDRSSLLAGGAGGHDGNFYLASDDGAFRLNVNGYMQFRYLADFRDEDGGGDDFDSGFQTRRTKLTFSGSVYKDWSYNVMANFSRSTGSLVLNDAYVDYSFNDKWKIRMGQSKIPLLREELVSDHLQVITERSLVNSAFTQDRSQLVQLTYTSNPINIRAAFSDGLNSGQHGLQHRGELGVHHRRRGGLGRDGAPGVGAGG